MSHATQTLRDLYERVIHKFSKLGKRLLASLLRCFAENDAISPRTRATHPARLVVEILEDRVLLTAQAFDIGQAFNQQGNLVSQQYFSVLTRQNGAEQPLTSQYHQIFGDPRFQGMATGESPWIAQNKGGDTVIYNINWKGDAVLVHSSPSQEIVLEWTSPREGIVDLHAALQDAHRYWGNDVGYRMELRTAAGTNILSQGTLADGTSADLTASQSHFAVHQGDRVALLISSVGTDGIANNDGDFTQVAFTVALSDPPPVSTERTDFLFANIGADGRVGGPFGVSSIGADGEHAFVSQYDKIFGNPAFEGEATAESPFIAKNVSGVDQTIYNISWPKDAVLVHPAPDKDIAVTWQSPGSGLVTLQGGLQDMHQYWGNGASYRLELRKAAGGTSVLINAALADGASAPLERQFRVDAGDTLALIVSAKGPDGVGNNDGDFIKEAFAVTFKPDVHIQTQVDEIPMLFAPGQPGAIAVQSVTAPGPVEMVRIVPSLQFSILGGVYRVAYQNMPANMNWQITKDGQTNFVLGGDAIRAGSGTILITSSISDGTGQIILRNGLTDAVVDLHLRFTASGHQILPGNPTPTLALDALAWTVPADQFPAQTPVSAPPQYDALAAQLGTYPNLRQELEDTCMRLSGLWPDTTATALVKQGYPELAVGSSGYWDAVQGVQQDMDHAYTLVEGATSAVFQGILAARTGHGSMVATEQLAQMLRSQHPGVAWVLGMLNITPERVWSSTNAAFDKIYQEAVRLHGIEQGTIAQAHQNDIVAEQIHEAAQLAAAPTPTSPFPLGGYALGNPTDRAGVDPAMAGPETIASDLRLGEALVFLFTEDQNLRTQLSDFLTAAETDVALTALRSNPQVLVYSNPQVFNPVQLVSAASAVELTALLVSKSDQRMAVAVDWVKTATAQNLLNAVTDHGSFVTNLPRASTALNVIKDALPQLKGMTDAEKKAMANHAVSWVDRFLSRGIPAAAGAGNPLAALGALYLQSISPVVRALNAKTPQATYDILSTAHLIEYSPGNGSHPGKLVVINSGHLQPIGDPNPSEDGAQKSFNSFCQDGYEVLHFRVGLAYDPLMMNTSDFLTLAKNVLDARLKKTGPFSGKANVSEIEMMGYSWGGGQADVLIQNLRSQNETKTLPIHLALIDAVADGYSAFLNGPAVSERPHVTSVFNRYELQGNLNVASFVLTAAAEMAAAKASQTLGIPSISDIAWNAFFEQLLSPFSRGNPAHGMSFDVVLPGDDPARVFTSIDPTTSNSVDVNHITIDDQWTNDPIHPGLSVTAAAIAFLKSKAQ